MLNIIIKCIPTATPEIRPNPAEMRCDSTISRTGECALLVKCSVTKPYNNKLQ